MQALLLVDLQNDFFPGGALAVPKADQLFPLANDIQNYFQLVVASRDYHPPNHKSFASSHPGKQVYDVIGLNGLSQVLWPDHCVQNTPGSEFHPFLKTDRIDHVAYKGTDPAIDSYSCFFDNAHRKNTGLHVYLQSKNVTEVYIMGLATDYCVEYSVLDARQLGYPTYVIIDGCFGIEKNPGDIEKSIQNMRQAGASIVTSESIKKKTDPLLS